MAQRTTFERFDPYGGEEVHRRERLFVWALGLVVAAIVASFLFLSQLLVFPIIAFVGLIGYGWVTHQATTAKVLTLIATLTTLLTMGFITVFLFLESLPAVQLEGLSLFALKDPPWKPNGQSFSLIPMIWGTVMTTIIAALIAAPLGVLGALFIAEIAPSWAREIVKPAIEILAGIPSIVYGYIGFVTLNNYMRSEFLDGVTGSYLLTGVIIGIMALPTVVSVAEDALSAVPNAMRDGSVAMGATNWQTMKSISIPAGFSGISAAIILGLGRAIGETMAAASILGGGTRMPSPFFDLFSQGSTLTTLIATQYGNAPEMTVSALFSAGVVLFVVVAGMSVVSNYIQQRMESKLQGEA
jgi:phosphate transport system permease protein